MKRLLKLALDWKMDKMDNIFTWNIEHSCCCAL